MSLDFDTLEALRSQHPAWRLLRADSAALVASFLNRMFVLPNQRVISQSDLAEALEDSLYALREQRGTGIYPKSALEYLNDWAANDKAWLRKFYPPGTDEPHFDLTPATERALTWLQTLSQRSFVGTESRLLTLFDLLRQMSEGSQTDVELRVQELLRRRAAIDAEIERARAGDLALLGDTALKERFAQFTSLARELNLCYACIAVVANPAAGKVAGVISLKEIERTLESGMEKVRSLLEQALPGLVGS